MSEERTKILQMVADGKLTAEQAAQLLAAIDAGQGDQAESPGADAPRVDTLSSESPMTPYFGSLWLIPMYIGLVLFVCGALAVFPLYAGSGSWLLAVCGWPIFLAGLLTMLAAYFSRRSRWVHVRVTNIDGSQRNVRFSFPLPLGLTAWVLRLVSHFVPKLKDTGVDEVITALNEGVTRDQPLLVDVQEGSDGERVQVYIG
jgi:hypothetical protein